MARRSIAGPVIMIVIGFSLVVFSVIGILGIDFWSGFDLFFSNFGDSISVWAESFGEFMGAWGENFGIFLSNILTESGIRILGGIIMAFVGLAIIVASVKAFRR